MTILSLHISTLQNKQKLTADSLNDQTLKSTMEVVSEAQSTEVGSLVDISVKKLTSSNVPAAFDADNMEIIKQEVYIILKIYLYVPLENYLNSMT